MRRGALVLCALLALVAAACGGPRRPTPAPLADDSPDAVACRAEARSSDEVRGLMRQLNAENPNNLDRVREEARLAQVRVFRACMRRRGAALPGGVEPQRRPL